MVIWETSISNKGVFSYFKKGKMAVIQSPKEKVMDISSEIKEDVTMM